MRAAGGIDEGEPKHRRVLRGTAPDEEARSPVLRGELHPRRLGEVKAALERPAPQLEGLLDPAGGQIVQAVNIGGRNDTAHPGREWRRFARGGR